MLIKPVLSYSPMCQRKISKNENTYSLIAAKHDLDKWREITLGLISSGVPQYSALTSFLFIIYIINLDCGIASGIGKSAIDTKNLTIN